MKERKIEEEGMREERTRKGGKEEVWEGNKEASRSRSQGRGRGFQEDKENKGHKEVYERKAEKKKVGRKAGRKDEVNDKGTGGSREKGKRDKRRKGRKKSESGGVD